MTPKANMFVLQQERRSHQFLIRGLGSLFLAALLVWVGCDSNEAEPEGDDAVELNLETLEAETEHGTLEAERVGDSYVTAMGEGRAIGIALLGEESVPDRDAERDVTVSLYEGGELAALIGTVDSTGEATLESADQSDFDATVELLVEGEAVTGTATFADEETTSFTAETATGVGGVYWADGTEQDPDVSGNWVVLPDERQWGCACLPPYNHPCCRLAF